jgi:molybdenum cofactor cytidylyltransferase
VSGDAAEGLHAIVLAAGASTRFGSAKQLVRLGGHPLLHTAVARAAEVAGAAVVVVLGANAADLTPLLTHTQASIVINRDWREGMASSVRAGIARLPSSCTAVLLMVVDQAAVTAEDLKRLVGNWRRQPEYIAAATYGDVAGGGTITGVPAVFPRSTFSDLQSLRGDMGARVLLRRNPDRVVRVPMPSAAIDIDTPEDLLKLTSER